MDETKAIDVTPSKIDLNLDNNDMVETVNPSEEKKGDDPEPREKDDDAILLAIDMLVAPDNNNSSADTASKRITSGNNNDMDDNDDGNNDVITIDIENINGNKKEITSGSTEDKVVEENTKAKGSKMIDLTTDEECAETTAAGKNRSVSSASEEENNMSINEESHHVERDKIFKGVLLGSRIARDFKEDYNSTTPTYHMGIISTFQPCVGNTKRIFETIPTHLKQKPKLDKGLYRITYLDDDADDFSPQEALDAVMLYNRLQLQKDAVVYGMNLDVKFPIEQYPNPNNYNRNDVLREEAECDNHHEDVKKSTNDPHFDGKIETVRQEVLLTSFGFVPRANYDETTMELLDIHPTYYDKEDEEEEVDIILPTNSRPKLDHRPYRVSGYFKGGSKYISSFETEEKAIYAKELFEKEKHKNDSFNEIKEKVKELVDAKFSNDNDDDKSVELLRSNSRKRKSKSHLNSSNEPSVLGEMIADGSITPATTVKRIIAKVEHENQTYNVGYFSTEKESELAKNIFKREMKKIDLEKISTEEASRKTKAFVQNLIKTNRNKGAINDPTNYHVYQLKVPRKSTNKTLSKDNKYKAQCHRKFLGWYAAKDDADFAERVFHIRLALIGDDDDVPIEEADKQESTFVKKLMNYYVESEQDMTPLKRKQPGNDNDGKTKKARNKKCNEEDDFAGDEKKKDPKQHSFEYSNGSFSLKVWCKGTMDDVSETKKAFSQLLKNRNTNFRVNGKATGTISTTGKIRLHKWINGTKYLIGDFETQAEADEALEIFTELRESIDRKAMPKHECENRIHRAIRIARAACSTGKKRNPEENEDASNLIMSSEGIESEKVPALDVARKTKTPRKSDYFKLLKGKNEAGITKSKNKWRYSLTWRGKFKHVGNYDTREEAVEARAVFLQHFELKLAEASDEVAMKQALDIVREKMNVKSSDHLNDHDNVDNDSIETGDAMKQALDNSSSKDAVDAGDKKIEMVRTPKKRERSNDLESKKDTGISKLGSKWRYAFIWKRKYNHVGVYRTQEEAAEARSIFFQNFESKVLEASEEVAIEHACKVAREKMKLKNNDHSNAESNLDNESMEIGDAVKHALDNSLLISSEDIADTDDKKIEESRDSKKGNFSNDFESMKEKGICKQRSKWRYAMSWRGKFKHVGNYGTYEEAEMARAIFLQKLESKALEASDEVAIEHALVATRAMMDSSDQINPDNEPTKTGDIVKHATDDQINAGNEPIETGDTVKHATDVSSSTSHKDDSDIEDKSIEDNGGVLPENIQQLFHLG